MSKKDIIAEFDKVINSIKHLYEVTQTVSTREDFLDKESEVEDKIWQFKDLLVQSLK
jgi:hypothetical protein